jgi:phage tail-like protein
MSQPAVTATPYDPLLTYQFRLQLLDPPADSSPEQLATTRGTLAGASPGSTSTPDIGTASTGYVAGVRRVSGLTMTVAATETWEGGNSLHRYANPHRAVWEPILLEQGISLDTSLQAWAEAGVRFLRTGTVDMAQPVKRNVLLDVWDPGFTNAGDTRPRLRYVIFNAWVSKYQAIPRLDAMADEVALLSVELTHHGWRRDSPPDLSAEFTTPQ